MVALEEQTDALWSESLCWGRVGCAQPHPETTLWPPEARVAKRGRCTQKAGSWSPRPGTSPYPSSSWCMPPGPLPRVGSSQVHIDSDRAGQGSVPRFTSSLTCHPRGRGLSALGNLWEIQGMCVSASPGPGALQTCPLDHQSRACLWVSSILEVAWVILTHGHGCLPGPRCCPKCGRTQPLPPSIHLSTWGAPGGGHWSTFPRAAASAWASDPQIPFSRPREPTAGSLL